MLSGITPFHYNGYDFFVKRDEQIHPHLSGNKYYKLYTLLNTPAETYQTMISYGGNQSNAMLAIAHLCQQKGWAFEYICKPLPQHLKGKPTGNLKAALNLNMQLIECSDYDTKVSSLKSSGKTLVIPQGGSDPLAQAGIAQLGNEITTWQAKQNTDRLNIVTPSGTGTTAFYLAQALPSCRIITTALVGDNTYLKQQMQQLGNIPSNLTLLKPSKKYRFAKPYPEFLQTYDELKHAGVEFDLIYAPLMWQTLLENMKNISGTVLYVHSGGLMGNATMLERYSS